MNEENKIGRRLVARRPHNGGWIVERDGQWIGWYDTELKAEAEARKLALIEADLRDLNS